MIAVAVALATGLAAPLLGIVACSPAPDRVVLGVALSSSSHAGVALAAAEINRAGGISGVPLELMGLEWDAGEADAEAILRWSDRFADEPELLGVIGHSDSVGTLTSAAVYNRREVPQLVTIATNPAITDIGDWTYRLCVSDAHQGPALAEYAVESWNKSRLAVLYVNDDYGKGLALEFQRRARQLGAEIVLSAFHADRLDRAPDDQQRIRAHLVELASRPPSRRPELLVLFQRASAGLWTTRVLADIGLQIDLLGGDNFGVINFVSNHPPTAEGMRAAAFWVPDRQDPRVEDFLRAYRERTGEEPDYAKAFAYDAVHLFRQAVEEGGFSRAAVKGHLDELIDRRERIRGVTGTYRLGPDHDARRDFYIVEIRDHALEPVETISAD